ncbi:MAG: insulinase family protein [Desulfovibrio sp.]|nr:insulinase family protein [Desulfovibrio sp.]
MLTYDFKLEKEQKLAEVGGVARLWIHPASGARLLSICNNDENKCFGASFYTAPVNSAGVAHILEHSVLNGSEKYPVKEPFAELLKGSLQTFLNAFTFPDKTCYPVASANLRDFYNLIDVYLDAVFHPILSRDTFMQEGWHIEAETADGPWTFKGVVYNEMKGVYSSPDSALEEKSQQAIFPDNLYCLDSGGNPQDIPNLTYEAFRDFHHRYYQPGNAWFFFWGDDPEEERLRIISEAITGAGPVADLPEVALQKPFARPRFVEFPYAAAPGETRAQFTLNWLLPERRDLPESIKLEILEHILEGLPGSPLRRALTESGLGEDTTGRGLETDLRQMFYSTGLKGIEPANIPKAEELILNTLRGLATGGIAADNIEAAVNTVEFAYRENNSGRFPRGLAAMILALSSWLYGGDPIDALAWEKPLAQIKEAVAKGEKIFEAAINKYFLDNPSRVRVVIYPDESLAGVLSEAEKERLATIQAESSPGQREDYAADTKRLLAEQTKPDSPEDLAKIPALKISDLPRENKSIPLEIIEDPATCLLHPLDTSGIAYVDLLLPIERLPEELIPYLPIFARSFTELGTAKEDYSQLGTRIAGTLGGLSVAPLIGAKTGSRETFAYLKFSSKAVYGNLGDMFSIFDDILLRPQTVKKVIIERLGQMILEDKARLEHTLQQAGHLCVTSAIKARYTGAGALGEIMSGLTQLRFLRTLSRELEENPEKILAAFADLRSAIVSGKNAVVNCVAEESALPAIVKDLDSFLKALPKKDADLAGEAIAGFKPMSDSPLAEAILTPGQVNYVAKGANLYDLGYDYNGSANVIVRWIRMGRLWEEVRVAGGAYGVFATLDRIGGTFICASYRDPNVEATLSAYDNLGPFLQKFNPDKTALDQAIIGAIGDLDVYLLPDAKGALSMLRWLTGETPESLQKIRERIFATTGADFRAFGEVLSAAAESGCIRVLGGETTKKAAEEHGWATQKLL